MLEARGLLPVSCLLLMMVGSTNVWPDVAEPSAGVGGVTSTGPNAAGVTVPGPAPVQIREEVERP